MRQRYQNQKKFQLKKIIWVLYFLLIATMATATFVEHQCGTEYVSKHIYGAWWFCMLWGLLGIGGIATIIRTHLRNIPVILLHASFILILLGALMTYLFAEKGVIHLRLNIPTNEYLIQDANKEEMQTSTLPFTLRLTKFEIAYSNGTDAVQNYVSNFIVSDGYQTERAQVSVNHIYSYRGRRFYQNSYDNDNQGTYLSINYDPYGITLSYAGYALLFLSFFLILINPKGTFRKILRNPLFRKMSLIFLLFTSIQYPASANLASTTLSRKTAEDFGKLFILYNGRICPLQTFALDFTQKVYGNHFYHDLSSEQILLGWIFNPDTWDALPLIQIKDHRLREMFHLPHYTSLRSFFPKEGYLLDPLTEAFYQGQRDQLHQAAVDLDARIQLIMNLRQGDALKIFPCHQTTSQRIVWYAPTAILPMKTPHSQQLFIHNIFLLLNQKVQQRDENDFKYLVAKIKNYQQNFGGKTLPSSAQIKAEFIYNHVPFATILFILNLTMGFVSLGCIIYRFTRKNEKTNQLTTNFSKLKNKWKYSFPVFILVFSFLALTYCELLRWVISGTIPMANGYETMLLLAWFVMLLTLVTYQRFQIMLTFGFLLSGFFLLVSHISEMDPQITPIMPVLHSPLLSIHVSIIMMSFALLSVTFICGITALMIHAFNKNSNLPSSLQILSQLFLYPALATLGIGIFIGAIWANISWGQYWSWDPKEVWALITLMCYAVAVHTKIFPAFRKPLVYHIYISLAFITILMTYFGVNYFLGGLHSYAG